MLLLNLAGLAAVYGFMNYLAHFYLDHAKPLPHFTAGVTLPDLARSFGSKYRVKAFEIPPHAGCPHLLSEINKGVARHHEADHWFHTSAFFKQQFQLVKTHLYAARLQSIPKYTYFVAHVLLEMLIDRLLMKQHPQLCPDFYAALLQTDTQALTDYMNLWGMPPENTHQFVLHFERFCAAQYLFEYQHNEGLLYALERVYMRMVGFGFSPADKKHLENCLTLCEAEIAIALPDLF